MEPLKIEATLVREPRTYVGWLQIVDAWEHHLATVAAIYKMSGDEMLARFVELDALEASGAIKRNTLKPGRPLTIERTYENRWKGGQSRTATEYIGDAYEPDEDREHVARLAIDVLRRLDDFHSGAYAAAEAARKVARERTPARSNDAERKRRARAEGRVKARPKKGPPTLEARIAAAEKSLVTRKTTLAELKSNPNWVLVSAREVMRTEEGIRRTEKSLATYRARLQQVLENPAA